MFPSKKRPDMSMLLGGKRAAPEEAPPSPFGASAAEPEIEAPTEEMVEAGGLTPEMLSYHGGAENCGACLHFTDPSTCDRFPDPVEAAGYCRGFESGDTGDQMQAADMEPMAEGVPA